MNLRTAWPAVVSFLSPKSHLNPLKQSPSTLRTLKRASQITLFEPLENRTLLSGSLSVTDTTAPTTDLSLNAGTVQVGSTSTTNNSFTLTNNGSTLLNVFTATISDTNDFDVFSPSQDVAGEIPGVQLEPAQSVSWSVIFHPLSSGTKTSTITFNTDDPANPSVTLNVSGFGTVSALTITNPTGNLSNFMKLAATDVGSTSASQVFTFLNPTVTPVTLTNFTLDNTTNFTYQVKDNTATPTASQTNFTIPAFSSYTVTVNGKPTALGLQNGHFTWTENGTSDASLIASVQIKGLAPPAPVLYVVDDVGNPKDKIIPFEDTFVTSTSPSHFFLLKNKGTVPLIISSITLAAGDTQDFSFVNNVSSGFTINPGLAQNIVLRFTPTATGRRTAFITLSTNDTTAGPNGIVTLEVSGRGLPNGPSLIVSDTTKPAADQSIILPSVNVGATSSAGLFILHNVGNSPLTVTGLTVGGANPGDFHIALTDANNNPISGNFSVAAGSTANISVTFSPSVTTHESANVTFTTNDVNTANQNVTLNMAGTPLPNPPASPSSFTATATGASAIQLSFTDADSTKTGYHLYVSSDSTGPFGLFATIASKLTSYNVTGLAGFTHYYFKLAAFNTGGESAQVPADTTTLTPALTDANNTPATATNLGTVFPQRDYYGYVADGDTVDYVKFTLPTTAVTNLNLLRPSADAALQLFKLTGVGTYKFVGQSFTPSALLSQTLAAGTYLAKVSQVNPGDQVSYDLAISSDFAGNSFAASRFLGSNYHGANVFVDSLGVSDTSDYYKFTLGVSRVLQLNLNHFTQDLDLDLIDRLGNVITTSDNSGLTPESITQTLAAGIYYIRVTAPFPTADTGYRLTVSAT